MGKKNRKKHRKLQENNKQQENKKKQSWFAPFLELGIKDESELFELLYEDEDCEELTEEEQENGYPDWALADQYYYRFSSPQTLHISKYKEKYFFWIQECCVSDYTDDPVEDFMVFNTLEEARRCRDSYPKGEKPIKEQIYDCKDAIEGDIWIDVKGDPASYGSYSCFNVKYRQDLLIEYLRDLSDIEYIKKEIQRYKEIRDTLEKEDASLTEIYKPRREWNSNIRYYTFVISFMGEQKEYTVQIFKKYQHQTRSTLDFMPIDKILADIREAKASGAYDAWKEKRDREIKEWKEMYEKSFQGIPHGEGIAPVPLNKEQKESLRKYYETHMKHYGECDGTMRRAVQWCMENIPEEDRAGVLEGIRNGGGYCDCEVLMNYLY